MTNLVLLRVRHFASGEAVMMKRVLIWGGGALFVFVMVGFWVFSSPWLQEMRLPDDYYLGRYHVLSSSKDAADQKKVAELKQEADVLYQWMLQKHPELQVEYREVPPEQNQFLQWWQFLEEMGQGQDWKLLERSFSEGREEVIGDAQLEKDWLKQQGSVLAKIREIGLLEEVSYMGFAVDQLIDERMSFLLPCQEALLLEAKVAATNGDEVGARTAVKAARGLVRMLGKFEIRCLYLETIRILGDLQVCHFVFDVIFPTLGNQKIEVSKWEEVFMDVMRFPKDFAEVYRGEWHFSAQMIYPVIVDEEEPYPIRDASVFLDAHARFFTEKIELLSGSSLSDYPNLVRKFENRQFSHLSERSQKLISDLYDSERGWNAGMLRAICVFGFYKTAFEVMKGEAVPVDPIYGQPYRWDPVTGEFATPDTPEFPPSNQLSIILPILP